MSIVFDVDDFNGSYFDKFERLKERYPKLKLTLFTIPYKANNLEKYASLDWIELAVHGWNHHSNYECMGWDDEKVTWVLDKCESMGVFIKGFKAPGWQIQSSVVGALGKRGYWLCNHWTKDEKVVEAMKEYKVNLKIFKPKKYRPYNKSSNIEYVHYHIYDDFDSIKYPFDVDSEFMLMSEVLK